MKTLSERFLEKIEHEGDCWVWKGANGGNHTHRYGLIQAYGKLSMATHVSLKLFRGVEVPKGMLALHAPRSQCRTSLCVNPDHLRVGSHSENSQDKVVDGTSSAAGERLRKHPELVRGQNNARAKLTEADARAILASNERLIVLARRYGVSSCTVNDIRRRRTWQWLT
jgi:hypothetical protein